MAIIHELGETRRNRPTLKGYSIALAVGAGLGGVAHFVPATAPYLFTAVGCAGLLWMFFVLIPRGPA